MKLYLARHTQTNYNVQGLANSDPSVDVHLSEKGVQQAQELAELLRDVDYDVVYVSELPRTWQTAEIINESHHKEIIADGRINDNRTGFEGKTIAEWQAAVNNSDNRWGATFHGGESLNEAAARAREFIDELKTKPYNSVLIVTHGFMVQAIFGYLENKSLDEALEFSLPQGSYAEFEVEV